MPLPPMSTPSTRRLAAVLIADVAGYSRMMERDEPGTHARLAAVRSEVTDPAVLRHGGRIVRTVGDGFLVEFPSAMSALEAAIEIQREMALRNRDVPAPQRIDHRIGINLGDIIVDERDIAGTGVNVAARIEALATPGGIAISGTVRDQVRQDLGIRLVDAGRHQVKNISRPIRVFQVELEGGVAAPSRRWRGRWMAWAAAAALLLAFAAALLAFWPQSQDLPPQSLIVLPFDHPPQSPRTAALAEALTRQVTVAATQLPGATVIAPAVAAQYAARRGDIRSIGRELKVRYALDGRIEDAGSDLRLVAQVIDTATASSLWSGTLQAPQNADGSVPPALVGELSDSLRSVLRSLELKRLASGRDAASAYAVALAAVEALERSTDGDQLPAIRARFERALALDPQHVPALSGYAHTLVMGSWAQCDGAKKRPPGKMAESGVAAGSCGSDVKRRVRRFATTTLNVVGGHSQMFTRFATSFNKSALARAGLLAQAFGWLAGTRCRQPGRTPGGFGRRACPSAVPSGSGSADRGGLRGGRVRRSRGSAGGSSGQARRSGGGRRRRRRRAAGCRRTARRCRA